MDALPSKIKVFVKKDTGKSEKKRRKQDERQSKWAASRPKTSRNTFEALGTADQGEDIADDDEGDGKQRSIIENFLYL